jgi:hypothetical protein
MEASIISALAALAGTAVGGMTSLVANLLTQHVQLRAQSLSQEKTVRQTLYREFIEEASKCYIDALQHDKADIPSLISLYGKLGRMRVLSSERVVHCGEYIAKKILDTYAEPDKTFSELRDMANHGAIDLLHEFSVACRAEFEELDGKRF